MKKHICIKIILVLLLWELFNLLCSLAYYQSGVETSLLNLAMLFLLFYVLGKRQQLQFAYFKRKDSLKNRMPEVFAAYGWIMLFRILFSLLLVCILFFVTSLPELSNGHLESASSLPEFLYSILITGLLTPVVEEFVFRGVIFDITTKLSRKKALLFNVLIFSLLHGNLLSIMNALLAGIALFELREKHQDLMSCIMLHIMINCIGVFNTNGVTFLYFLIMIFSAIYYCYYFLKWKRSPNKDTASLQTLCIKYNKDS